MTPEVCPHCGAEVPPKAKACPECGSDEQSGWSEEWQEEAKYAALDLPDENFDYNEFVKEEFGQGRKSPLPRGIHWFWWVVGVVLLAGIVLYFVF